MSTNKIYTNPIYLDKINNSYLIVGKSFFKNNTIYLNNMDKTIFYFIKNKNIML